MKVPMRILRWWDLHLAVIRDRPLAGRKQRFERKAADVTGVDSGMNRDDRHDMESRIAKAEKRVRKKSQRLKVQLMMQA
ncbi:hypothetical protein LINGRAPRIM_LOCUS2547 [Linum grandiflorum]